MNRKLELIVPKTNKEKKKWKKSIQSIPPVKDQFGTVIDGNHRYSVAIAMGMKEEEIPFVTQVVDYNGPYGLLKVELKFNGKL